MRALIVTNLDLVKRRAATGGGGIVSRWRVSLPFKKIECCFSEREHKKMRTKNIAIEKNSIIKDVLICVCAPFYHCCVHITKY